jgi:hypothetical protein
MSRGFAHEGEARGLCDREGVTIAAVAELELALEVGAPQIVGAKAFDRGRARCAGAPFAHAFNEAVTVEDGMDGAFGGQANVTRQPAQEELPDLAGAPVW